ncbi:hypothetical protein DFP72DRAFT_1047462 [Ephemerocybe angulata]|uniref:Uncharacterized protein n=1 Tax=Ephemerocybe angulata TaxID=980116 RepID=A0A8H6HTJ3_9AGAR|nr:hypothetical protein DFP72DRAFT_1047462 [Tulosesus angulatus]
MHLPTLHLLSIVASLAVLSRAHSDHAFDAREYMDELSTRTDAVLSSLATRELIAELSERLDRRKVDPHLKYVCIHCQKITRLVPGPKEVCPNLDNYRFHEWGKMTSKNTENLAPVF